MESRLLPATSTEQPELPGKETWVSPIRTDHICHKAGGHRLLALGTPPKSLRFPPPPVTLPQSVCHPVLNAKSICSSAAWMPSGQKAAGTTRWRLQRPCAENCQLVACKDNAQLNSTLQFLALKHQQAKFPQHLQEPQSIPAPMSRLGSIRSLGSRTPLPAAAEHEIFRGAFLSGHEVGRHAWMARSWKEPEGGQDGEPHGASLSSRRCSLGES